MHYLLKSQNSSTWTHQMKTDQTNSASSHAFWFVEYLLNNVNISSRRTKWLICCLPTARCLASVESPSFSSLQPYLDNSSVMFSSLIPPNTLNFFKLQTWVFSYFPKVMLWTTAGRSSFKTKNCRRERRKSWIKMGSLCAESSCSCGSRKICRTFVPFTF